MFFMLHCFCILYHVIKCCLINITLKLKHNKKTKLIVEWHCSWIYFFLCMIKLIILINDTCIQGKIKK
jgi:hypothetical protein